MRYPAVSPIPIGFVTCVLMSVPANSQSLEAYRVAIDVPHTDMALVRIEARVSGVENVLFSRTRAEMGSIEESVLGCDQRLLSSRVTAAEQEYFPALVTAVPADCAVIRLVYEVRNPGRIPLLVPDVKLGPEGIVRIELHADTPVSQETLPRMEWNGSTAIREMRHLPSFVGIQLGDPGVVTFNNAMNAMVFLLMGAAAEMWRRWLKAS